MSEPVTYFQDNRATITASSVRFHSKTYPIADMTAAEMIETKPPIILPILAGIGGLVIAILSSIFDIDRAFFIGIGVLLILCAGLVLPLAKRQHAINVTQASGSSRAIFRAPDPDYIQTIVTALNLAIKGEAPNR